MHNLTQRLERPEILIAPGVYDGLSALMAQKNRAEALFLSRAAIAHTQFGSIDLQRVTFDDLMRITGFITSATITPLIVDLSDGYESGDQTPARVKALEENGAKGIQLEDFVSSINHANDTPIPLQKMVERIKSAVDARRNDDTKIVVKSNPQPMHDVNRALDIAHAYIEAGAEIIHVSTRYPRGHFKTIIDALYGKVFLMTDMAEASDTQDMASYDLEAQKLDMVVFPMGSVRTNARQLSDYYGNLLADGSNARISHLMYSYEELGERLTAAG